MAYGNYGDPYAGPNPPTYGPPPSPNGAVPSGAAQPSMWKSLLAQAGGIVPMLGAQPAYRWAKNRIGGLRAPVYGPPAPSGLAAAEQAASSGWLARQGLAPFTTRGAVGLAGRAALPIGAGLLAGQLLDDEDPDSARSLLAETARGAGVGGAIGSVVPGIGTAVGALGGGAAAALMDTLGIDPGNPFSFLGGGGDDDGGGLAEQLVNYGMLPSQARQYASAVDQVKDAEGDDVANTLKTELLTGQRGKYLQQISGETPEAEMRKMVNDYLGPEPPKLNTLQLQQAVGTLFANEQDDSMRNINAAAQAARESGIPGIADQYVAMSKHVGNAYAMQALAFPQISSFEQQHERSVASNEARNDLVKQMMGGAVTSGAPTISAFGS